MEASSSSTSKSINGGIIKFKNRKCACGIKAAVKISESLNNPKKLYFFCERGKCNFYRFWEPDNEEFNLSEYTENISQRYDGSNNFLLQQELEVVKARLQKLEILWETYNHGRMHNLESIQGGSRMMWVVNSVLFGVTIAVLVLIMTSNHGM